jgi:hypothetical protein
VCHKHRKIRRETNPAGVSSRELAAVFVLFLSIGGADARERSAPLSCDHRSRAGSLSASQGMPVQVRLVAPFFVSVHCHLIARSCGGRQPAQRSLQNSAAPGQHRNAVRPGDECIVIHSVTNCGGARWEGAGLISRKRTGSIPVSATNFPFPKGCSIIQEVTCLASRRAGSVTPAVHQFRFIKSREG